MAREIEYAPEPKKLVPWSKLEEILARRCPVTLSEEIWFASKLKTLVPGDVFAEVTTRAERLERFRSVIRRAKLEDTQCGKRKGEPVTFAQVFQLIYGVAL
jgi:hypothetical protein